MTSLFGSTYADAYDALYQDKDYAQECDLIERVFQTYGDGPVLRLLDLGCGTGSHSLRLAERGYEVIGLDSSPEMLARARAKLVSLPHLHGRARFELGDVRSTVVAGDFDAALMMFAVLGYQLENQDVLAALRSARRQLRSGGLMVFDVWYGPAVLADPPQDRVRVIEQPNRRVIRAAGGTLDPRRHRCTVRYVLWALKDRELVDEIHENHNVRYFFPLELDLFLDVAGFEPLRLGVFPEFERDPDQTTWNVLAVARAR